MALLGNRNDHISTILGMLSKENLTVRSGGKPSKSVENTSGYS